MSDTVEQYTEEDLVKSIQEVMGFETEDEAKEYIISKASEDNGDDEEEMGDDGGEKDVEKAYSKMKGEYEEMEKAFMDKKAKIEEMEAKMKKGKVKKGEENELGAEKMENFVKSLKADLKEEIEKSFTEKLTEKETENDELKKSLEDLSSDFEEMKESFEKAMGQPSGKRGVISEKQVIEKSETEEQGYEGKTVISITNKNDLIKGITALMGAEQDKEKQNRYEADIMNLESGATTPSQATVIELQKSESFVFTK